MSIYRELSYDYDVSEVKSIRFCVMSPESIEKQSVAEIYKTDTYTNNEPVPNGLFDAKMGVIAHNKICPTCQEKNSFCPGHFGHVNLAKPVFYIQFFDTIKKILKCVCYRCSSLLFDKESPQIQAFLNKKLSRQKRWEYIYKMTKAKKCPVCEFKPPDKITREPIILVSMEWKSEEYENIILDAEAVLMILDRISESDADLMGFSKKYNNPSWMICKKFLVPPSCVRPSVITTIGQRSEDDLTHKLCDIVKANNELKTKIEKNADIEQIKLSTQTLQYHVATFVDNKIPGIGPAQQRTGRPLKPLSERIKSKDGRIRGNLMGKRVNFSARSVITPDPCISIDELGVPIKIAMNLTFPEVVNDYNKAKLQRFVNNGPNRYPGAKYIKKNTPRGTIVIMLDSVRNNLNIQLNNGDIVDRYLLDGDVVLFNRQPSLHKYSMLCLRVKIFEDNTFRLNVIVTPNFNADYDGDEMNMHVPQSIATATEIAELASVQNQIISVRECKPLSSIVQDIVLGIYCMSQPNIKVKQRHYFNLIAPNKLCLGPMYKKERFVSGRNLLSSIIPKIINLKMPNKSYSGSDDVENMVHIENGEIKGGTFDKTIYQARSKGLVHTIFNDCGPEETRLFFDNTQRLVCDWLVQTGFSVGVSDLLLNEKTKISLNDIINKMTAQVHEKIDSIHMGKFENKSVLSTKDFFENEVNNILNNTVLNVGKTAIKSIDSSKNRLISMIQSGSKGTVINVSQIVSCLGQQNIDGKRIDYGFEDRTLPHYSKFDDTPEGRGFVKNSFMSGLTPQEFFFHAMGGREGLIDTAVKTSTVGYLQRKLVKAMEDCKISYDYTVRNSSGNIIQYLYGEDGFDASKLESQPLPYITMDYTKMYNEYFMEKCEDHFQQLLDDREFLITEVFNKREEKTIMYPISFVRIINNASALAGSENSDLTVEYILNSISKLESNLYINKNNPANKFLGILLRLNLSPKKILYIHHLTKNLFDIVIKTIILRYHEAIAHPSEMIGVIAAQSLGEPCTQLTLNSFHQSGVSSASTVVRGVPRIQELLSVSKNMKTPSLTIYIKDIFKKDKMRCTEIMQSIKTTYMKHLVISSKIYYDPDDYNTTIEQDRDFVETYRNYCSILKTPSSPWLLRLELDKEKMYENSVTMIDILFKLKEFYGDAINLMFSDDNVSNPGKLVFRIKLEETQQKGRKKLEENKDVISNLKAIEKNIMENVIIKGIKGVNKASIRKIEYNEYNTVDMVFEKTYQWIIETNGSNLYEVLSHNMVDNVNTISNNIYEIYTVFGIEAARTALYNELWDVIVSADLYVNYRHIILLVDLMTNKGYPMSIDRHGINRSDTGPLAKSSFEETTDVIIKAGVFGEIDRINGVSANIILGQIPKCGTGDSTILINNKLLKKQESIIETYFIKNPVYIDLSVFDKYNIESLPPNKNEKRKIKIN